MIDPIQIGDGIFDRAEIVGLLRQEGTLILFLRGGKAVTIHDTISREEIEEICKKV